MALVSFKIGKPLAFHCANVCLLMAFACVRETGNFLEMGTSSWQYLSLK